MKILVPTKRVPDPDHKPLVRSDGAGLVEDDIPWVINPFDEVALEEAICLRERLAESVEVVAVGIGGEAYEPQLRTALAMGSDRAIHVLCEQQLDPWNVASILQQIVARESPQLVLLGKQAIDDDANQTGQFLAAMLGWPQATCALRIEVRDSGLRVARETDAGIETVRLTFPAVVTTDLRLNQPRYAALPAILRARKKPIERLPLDALDVTVTPRLSIITLENTSQARACQRLDSVEDLVDRLRQAKLV